MTRVVDLHPEALLDRDALGELTAPEEMRLLAHLEVCAACRFERALRRDFAEELASDPTPSERIALAGLSQPEPEIKVERAPEPLAPPVPPPSPVLLRRATRATPWLVAAAALFAVSVAGATGVGQRAWSHLIGPGPAPAAPAEGESATAHATPKRAPHHQAALASTAVTAPVQAAPSSDVLAPPLPAQVPAPKSHPAALPSEGASALFQAATNARRQGSYARAIDLQRELLLRYPHSREAHVARETMGRLLLDRGDPSGACASFDAYLADGSGELGEEAMFGRATALERLGKTAQAADAWRSLLAAYPETAYAAHAQSRLGGLSVR
jgi:TolA-binding protein